MNKKKKYLIFFIFGIGIISISFLFMIWLKPVSIRHYLPQYIKPFLGFMLIWFSISLLAQKYSLETSLKKAISKIIISNFYILSFILILIYLFDRFHYSRLIVLGTICLSTLFEIIFGSIYQLISKNPIKEITASRQNDKILRKSVLQEKMSIELDFPDLVENESINSSLQNKYLKDKQQVYDFINDHLPLVKIHKSKSLILDTNTFFNIENIEDNSQHLFINLHKVNDYRWLNKYFMQINANLQFGGFFVSWGQTLAERYNYFFNTYPRFIAFILFSGDFIIRRAIPKLHFFKQVYFSITKGKNRALSKAEILGRLVFCGFKIIAVQEIDNKLHFIVQKVSNPRDDNNPSYGPLMKMNRYGKDGVLFQVYKFRSMHPYSEYLQDYLLDKHGYAENGKIADDFRVSGWAKVLRKLWLDELPQLINVVKGEMVIVGVRPLSKTFLEEYPEELKQERFKYKPGCIPPYVALRMQAVEEYIESERIYLEAKKKHPVWTDIKFFFWAVFNILTRRIKSG